MTTSSRTEVSQSARVAQTAVDRANAAQLDLTIISESYRCQYPSKHCTSDRSVKRDGDLHKFCEFHRSKANRNQRKLEQKRKLEAKSPIARKAASPPPRFQRPRGSSERSSLSRSSRSSESGAADGNDDNHTPWDMLLPIDLDEHDIQALASLFEAADN
ncbi:hypothetical protein Gpo141_00003508 [Globisporangium polare]